MWAWGQEGQRWGWVHLNWVLLQIWLRSLPLALRWSEAKIRTFSSKWLRIWVWQDSEGCIKLTRPAFRFLNQEGLSLFYTSVSSFLSHLGVIFAFWASALGFGASAYPLSPASLPSVFSGLLQHLQGKPVAQQKYFPQLPYSSHSFLQDPSLQ